VRHEPAWKRAGGLSLMGTAVDSEAILVQHQRSGRRLWWWGAASLAILVLFLYRDIFAALVRQWWNDPDFSFGFFVPVLAAYVIWQRRETLMSLPAKPSWWGLAVMIGAVGILLLGVFGAELFLSRSSFIFLLAGLVIFFLGWDHFRALIFPWCFLFLMVPLPTLIMNEVTLPLQFFASSLATSLLRLVGVPVLRDGNVIQLPTMSLQVVEACSGIRSLVSLITLAVVYAYLFEKNKTIRVLLVVAAVPIAIAANGLRIMGTGLTGMYWSPDKAEGFFHEFSGWLIFVMSLLMLFTFHQVLRGFARWYSRRVN
jgi:exosortase